MKQTLIASILFASAAIAADRPYVIVGTGQTKCYDNYQEIDVPRAGQPFSGQDAQHPGNKPSYKLSADSLTVLDNVTGLTWQRSPDTTGDGVLDRSDKLTLKQAQALPAKLNAAKFGGFSDWRVPTIKELYSLIEFSGLDSGPGAGNPIPFIDTKYFKFVYGDTSKGERVIDSQYASSTKYVGKSFQGFAKLFGVNFADGRIKGYDLQMPGGRMEKTFFVICCRGNPKYGQNDFRDNGDGTITDRATGLVWQKKDSGKPMNWEQALAYAAKAGNGWRLPNAKELQSIVDYARCPDTSNSPAINPMFQCTAITNEIGKVDWSYYWTGTTHASVAAGGAGVYIAFGRAAGWPTGMPGRGGPGQGGPGGPRPGSAPGSGNVTYHYSDVHGAGAQRSDPKTGDPAKFPHGHGPQGDVIRIYNFVRLVRGG